VGHRFSLVLSREITADESTALKGAGCAGAVFSTDSLPTNADVAVTKMDFHDTMSPSLTEAIESALEAVKTVANLSVPGLTVPAQPIQASGEEQAAAITAEPAAKKASARKRAAKKAVAAEPAAANGHAVAINGSGHAADAEDPAQAATVGAGRP
jgi:hypothetical protein